MSGVRMARFNPGLALFGLLCVVVSALVLGGERDWGWLADSYVLPAILLGLGGIVLVSTLWPGDRSADPVVGGPAGLTDAPSTPPEAARREGRGPSGDEAPTPPPEPKAP